MVDDLQRTSEIMVFMVYVGKWRGGFGRGIAGRECGGLLVWCLVSLVSDECMRSASLIEQEEPSRALTQEWPRGEVFNYFLLLLPRQLDGDVVSNNCMATGGSIGSGKAATIQIHVTIQNTRYYLNSEYE
jgi:hypothetical protein